MSSIHLYIHTQPSCHMHGDAAQRSNADKNLRQGVAALIVLAMLERLLQAARHGGEKAEHAPSSAGCNVDKTHGVESGSNAGDKALGVLKPFLELLLLLALLCKQNHGRQGGANPVADKVADQLDDGGAPQGLAQDDDAAGSEPKATGDDGDAMGDAAAMMVSAMREGHKESLLGGKDDKAFESELKQMSSDLREGLTPEPESPSDGDSTTPADDNTRQNNLN
jgi:hypothetical protein